MDSMHARTHNIKPKWHKYGMQPNMINNQQQNDARFESISSQMCESG